MWVDTTSLHESKNDCDVEIICLKSHLVGEGNVERGFVDNWRGSATGINKSRFPFTERKTGK
jgi:hypothetical protein